MNKKRSIFTKCFGDIESGGENADHQTSNLTVVSEVMQNKNVNSKIELFQVKNKNFRKLVRIIIQMNRFKIKLNRNFNASLFLAIQEGDLQLAKDALNKGASADAACEETESSACHIAAYCKAGEILKELINRNANFKKKDVCGRCPLDIAAWQGSVECVEILVQAKYLKNTQEERVQCQSPTSLYNSEIKAGIKTIWSKFSALHLASACLHEECVRILLASDYCAVSDEVDGLTALDICGKQFYDFQSHCEDLGKIDDKEKTFWNIIQEFAAHNISHKITGAIQNSMRNQGIQNLSTTPLHIAAILDSERTIELLCSKVNAFIGCQDMNGDTPLHIAAANRKGKSLLALLSLCNKESETNTLNKKNGNEKTALHLAIESKWIFGVRMLLDNGSDFKICGPDKKTILHMAIENANVEMLKEICLREPKCEALLNICSKNNGTPIYTAITKIKIDCIEELLRFGTENNINFDLKGLNGISVFHKAAEIGDVDILEKCLTYESEFLKLMKDLKSDVSPLHLAAANNKFECIEILLEKGFDINVKGVFSFGDNLCINDKKNDKTWLPFHIAALKGYKECIHLFIKHGADISDEIPCTENGPKALDVITRQMHNPVEYLEDLCSSYIQVNNYHLDDTDCKITIDYSLLLPPIIDEAKTKEKYGKGVMRIVKVMTNPHSNYDQKKLILHPLIESFQYFQWKALKQFFFYILITYCFFVISLTALVIIVYKYENSGVAPPIILYKALWIQLLWISMIAVLIEDFLFISVKKLEYFKSPAAVIKMVSLILSFIVTIVNHDVDEIWPRYVTAGAILTAWIEIVMLLSRFPEFGYLYQMFATVAFRVLKVMALFGGFMIIGFSLAFWVLFKSKFPFDGPWNSIMKTIVMMTSEFDYSDMAGDKGWVEYPSFPQILFIIFLVSVPIVVMNLLIALAISDTKDLETDGRIERLFEQLQFLSTLDLIGCTPLWNSLPEFLKRYKKSCLFDEETESKLTIKPTEMKKYFTKHIITSIFQVIIKRNKEKQNDGNLPKVDLLANK